MDRYSSIFGLPIETFVCVLIISFLALYFCFIRKFDSHVVTKAPAILTTSGIFATFLGIAIGLFDFDAKNVAEGVPKLLNGIKTAVWASVVGILGAVFIKLKDFFRGHEEVSETEGSTIDDLASHLISLQKSIAGNDDSTLLNQLKLIRQDSNDRMDKINKSLLDFYEKVADNNSKALIEALKEVIKDFNTKINEQFGENFKQLNEAVGKILIWQEKYKNDMQIMIEQQSITTKNMSDAVIRYDEILSNTSKFTDTAENLSKIINALELQRNQLKDSLSSLANLLDRAGSGIPKLEEKILEMTQQISSSVSSCQNDLKNVLIEGIRISNDDFNKNIKFLVEQTKEQILVLDKALSDELTKSLESFGRQMAALSEKFANDYTPITEGLQRVLKIGKID